jgi:hypothetical protein
MTKLSQKIKNIVKNPADKVTFGTNPKDPWSAKADINEGSLDQYLKSKGINPEFVSKDQKISHAKSATFLKWKRDHQLEQVIPETMTLEPSLTQKKKSIQTKSQTSHKVIKTPPGPGSHNEGKGSQMTQLTPESTSMEIHGESKKPKMSALDKFRKASAEREKKHSDIEKKSGGMTAAIDRLGKHMNKEEVEQIDEISKSTLASYKDKSTSSLKNAQANRDAAEPGKNMSKGFADLHAKSDAIAKKRVKGLKGYLQRKVGMKPTSEDVGDPKAAVNADGQPNPQLEPVSEKKKQMSKSARMIKAIYKKHKVVKEDIYDHEKEDKSVATYGKKPKEEKADKDDSKGENKPQAALTLTGGKTLTGTERDTVEIDPMMRNRPGQPDVTKKDDKKKDDKKEDKKKDK